MPPGFGKRPLQFLQFLLLAHTLRLGGVDAVKLVIGIAVFQGLALLLFLAERAHSGKGVLVAEASRHLEHLVTGSLGVCLRQCRVDTVGRHGLSVVTASSESLHYEVYQEAQRNEYRCRKDILRLFEINLFHYRVV